MQQKNTQMLSTSSCFNSKIVENETLKIIQSVIMLLGNKSNW